MIAIFNSAEFFYLFIDGSVRFKEVGEKLWPMLIGGEVCALLVTRRRM